MGVPSKTLWEWGVGERDGEACHSGKNASAARHAGARVCLVALEVSVGGLERMLIELANGFAARGVVVRIVVMDNDDNTMIGEVPESIDVVCLRGPRIVRAACLRLLSLGYLVQLHFWGGHVRPLYRLALLGRPLIVTYQAPYPRARPWNWIDRLLSRQALGIITCSYAVAAWCEGTVGIPREKIRVAWNGASRLGSAPPLRSIKRERSDLEVLMVARLVDQKDPATLLRGFAAATREGLNGHLTIVGVGPLMERLLLLAYELDIPYRVTWLGELWEPTVVRQIMRNADVFVQASRWEGFGIVLLEAALEGLPLIVSDIAPHREALGEAPYYFPVGDHDLLSRTLLALARDPAARRRAAEASGQRAEQFSVDASVERHLALYNEFLQRTTAAIGRQR